MTSFFSLAILGYFIKYIQKKYSGLQRLARFLSMPQMLHHKTLVLLLLQHFKGKEDPNKYRTSDELLSKASS